MRIPLKMITAAAALVTATPSIAALTLVSGGSCSITTPSPNAAACAGAYAGNLNNTARQADLNAALDVLVGGDFAPDIVFTNIEPTGSLFTLMGTSTLDFAHTLFGQQILSIHFGDAGTGLGDRTILYLFNFGTTGANSVMLGTNGFSNAVLVTPTPVPEAATWALMLIGLGAVGISLRVRRKRRSQKAVWPGRLFEADELRIARRSEVSERQNPDLRRRTFADVSGECDGATTDGGPT